jgi:SAM-dependent methyltransferase
LFIKRYLKRTIGLTILDQGCGNGYEILNLNEQLPGNEFLGIDVSPIRCQEAKKMIDLNHVANASCIVGDGARLPLVSGFVDVIISNQVIEHVEDQGNYVREGHRVLCRGGVYLLTTENRIFPWEGHLLLPFIPWLPKRLTIILLRLKYADWRHDFYESVYPLSTFAVEGLLRSIGFSRVLNASLYMLKKPMIATIPPGRGKFVLEMVATTLEALFQIPIFGPAFRRILSSIFPYAAFICIS